MPKQTEENIFEKPNSIFEGGRDRNEFGINETKADGLGAGNGTDYLSIRGALWAASSFTIGKRKSNRSIKLTGIKVWIKRVLNPGTITCSIRNASNQLPTGADLDSATRAQTDTTTTAQRELNFDFTKGILLKRSTQYTIVIRATSGSVGNEYRWDGNLTTFEIGGETISSSTNSGSTWSTEASDMMMAFEVYGIPWD